MLILRNLLFMFIVGSGVGILAGYISQDKKVKTIEVILGIIGAFSGNLILGIFRGGIPVLRIMPVLLFQILGSVCSIWVGRLVSK